MQRFTWLSFKTWVAKLFGKTIEEGNRQIERDSMDALEYMDISTENITAMVANALAVLTFGDASMTITPDSPLTDILRDVLGKELIKAKRNISCGLGVGMIVSIPYCVDNGLGRKIYVDTITKDRVFITGQQGDDITQLLALADIKEIGNTTYTRWTEYSVEDGAYVIRNKAMKEATDIPLTDVDAWANIEPEVRITGVERLPIGIFKCPAGGRRPDTPTGVPITFGCKPTMDKIANTLNDIEVEFKRKKTKVFADRSLLKPTYDANGNLIKSDFDDDLFVKFGASDNFTTEIFSPDFRESAYFTKLTSHMEMLEKEIGVSKGILTALETSGATATEIRRATYSTFCLVDDIRREYEKYIKDLAYGVEVLASAFGMARNSEYDVSIDWSYAMLEDSQESWAQLKDGQSMGAVSVAEVRQYLKPGETLEESIEAVNAIREDNPPVSDLLGGIDTE